jgi:peptidoglycan L-alanyl-D-glutamate endopeptidase CwlK
MKLTDQQVEELFKRVNQSLIHPWLLSRCKQLVKNCAARGVLYYAISGTRTWAEQQDLYNKGRDSDGKVIDPKAVVTKALPGTSMHNYGLAIDFCRDKDADRAGLQPDWEIKSYKVLAEEAQKLGLEAGFFWKSFVDAPHIQVPLTILGISSVTQLRQLQLKRGAQEVEAFLKSKLQ